jgi:hypothetical protein
VANHLLAQSDEKAKEVTAIIVERLSASDDEDIRSTIEQGSSPFSLILALQKRKSLDFDSDSKPYRALNNSLVSLLTSPNEVVERWFALLEVLGAETRQNLADRLAEALLASERSPSLPLIIENGNKLLMSSAVFTSDPTRSIERVVLPAMRSRAGRDALKIHKKVVANWAANARKRSQTRLRKRLQNMGASSVKERKSFARAVTKVWIKD